MNGRKIAMKAEWRKTGSLGLLLVMAAALLCPGCTNFFGKQSSSGAPASLTVSFSAPSAKTVTASSSDLLSAVKSLAIAVVNSSGTTVATGSVTYSSSSGTTKTFDSLAAATYTVKVNAYDASSNLIATGSQTVAMAGNALVTVNLTFSQTSTVTSGGFSLNIAWPTSTTLPYVYAKLDSATASNFFNATGTVSSSNYTATIAKSGLSSGSHLLYIYFAASSSATTYLGPYIETVNVWDSVTSTSWLDGSGNCLSQRSFAASDFASSNADLLGLSISGATLSPAFAAGTTSYSLSSSFTGASFSFTATTVSGTQNATYIWNGAAQSWASVIGDVFSASNLACISGTNTLTITVTAPDKQTTQAYTVSVICGAAGVTITTPTPSYAGLGFPSSATIVQGQVFALETSNSTLDAISSGWKWYLGDAQDTTQTTQRFVFSPSTTDSMLGTYNLAGSVKGSDGVTYSGRLALTVNQLALNPSGSISTLATGFYGPVAVTAANGYLYVAENKGYVISQVSISTGTPTVFAGSGSTGSSNGITTDGTNLYVSDTGNHAIRKIVIATRVVNTIANDSANLAAIGNMVTDGSSLYVADGSGNAIRKVDIATGAITTLASFSITGGPWGMATDGTNLFISFPSTGEIYKGHLGGSTFTPWITGLPTWGLLTDGTYLYASGYNVKAVYKILISTASATTLVSGGDMSDPRGLATDGANLYLVDYASNCIWGFGLLCG